MNALTNRCSLLLSLAILVPIVTAGCRREAPEQGTVAAPSEIIEDSQGAADEESPEQAPDAYHSEIQEWQQERAERLQADDGWLSLVGLHWLEDGPNTIGSGPDNSIVFPEGKAPKALGTIILIRGSEDRAVIQFEPAEGSELYVDGKPVTRMIELTSDASGDPTELRHGTLSFFAIVRGDRFGLRVRDSESPALVSFAGLEHFPVDPRWKIEARFEPYDPPMMIPIANIVGIESEEPSPGAIVFEVRGRTYRLDALDGGEDELFIIFSDATTGNETYGAGRYLYTPRARAGGRIVIDFNKAYNPPCAFTEFATCPLPPRQNKLRIRIEAGEKNYHMPEPETDGTQASSDQRG